MASSAVLHYYVYYRIDASRTDAATTAVGRFQDNVFSQSGIRGRRLHRRDDPALWMEVYEGVPPELDLASMLAHPPPELEAVLAPGAARITECFTG